MWFYISMLLLLIAWILYLKYRVVFGSEKKSAVFSGVTVGNPLQPTSLYHFKVRIDGEEQEYLTMSGTLSRKAGIKRMGKSCRVYINPKYQKYVLLTNNFFSEAVAVFLLFGMVLLILQSVT